MGQREDALKLHKDHQGKLKVVSKVPVRDKTDLSLAYTPGVAEPCKEIQRNLDLVYEYTNKANFVAVVTDGTAVLGLGDIGPEAGMPVMEGKCVLFKCFAGVDAFPLCIASKDVDEIVETVKLVAPTFGGVNLEDISAPRCFEIEARLKKETDIPIFHDDQHGTAIVCGAVLLNALKVVGKDMKDVKIVMNGAGAGGIAVAKLLLGMGVGEIVLCDSRGAIYEGRTEGMNWAKEEMAKVTNRDKVKTLAEGFKGADVFIGLSVAGAVTQDMVRSMNRDPVVLPMANPVPEIFPDEAKAAGAKVVGTGRSDFPNQVNNVLAFPGVFRGALDARAKDISEGMKVAATHAMADLISESELNPDYVIPKPFDRRVAPAVAAAVAEQAMKEGLARVQVDPQEVARRCVELVEKANAEIG
ncbi:MAG TPA: NAD-dependent malic enzyme [Clostridiales bacterium]|nr:NAD-dependent malic enzyme [Clostridiales bacterium]